jgi:hypothetical protein
MAWCDTLRHHHQQLTSHIATTTTAVTTIVIVTSLRLSPHFFHCFFTAATHAFRLLLGLELLVLAA